MNYQFCQTLSTYIIFIGVIFTGLGGIGQYYFGKKIDKEKDELRIINENNLNENIDMLLQGNNELKEVIKPFEELARQKFPGEDVNTALNNLSKEITRIDKEHQKTYYKVTNQSCEPQKDGSYIYKFNLTPVGHNVIPILAIECHTENKTKITDVKITGRTVPIISYGWTSEDKSAIREEFRDLYPGEIKVEITTESNPDKLNVKIDPYKDE